MIQFTRERMAMAAWILSCGLLQEASSFTAINTNNNIHHTPTISSSSSSSSLSSSSWVKPRQYSTFLRMATDETEFSNSSSTATATTIKKDNTGISQNNNNEDPWWKNIQFKDAVLATSIRDDFPILSTTINPSSSSDVSPKNDAVNNGKPLIYFDSAATSQKPTHVLNDLTNYYQTLNSNVHRGAHTLSRKATSQYEGARDAITNFIHANNRNEVIFTSGATEALNLIAYTFGRQFIEKDDEIIITELEHHSNIVPWQQLCQEKGAILKYIPLDTQTGCLDISVLPSLVTEKTKIVSFQHVSNVMACINPVDEIVSHVRANASPDAKIILDACQSVPHMPINVQTLNVDFVAASGHKMCGPTGIGFLWGKEDLLNSIQPFMGGGEMIDEVYMTHSTYAPSPARFEAGTPSIAQAIGLGSAISYLNKIGMDRIHAYESEIASYFMKRMSEVNGVTILGPELGVDRAAIVSFVCEGVHPSDLSTFLDMEGVAIRAGHHCCQPLHRALGYSHSARASLYFYNTKEEIDTFIEKLEETMVFLGGGDDSDDDFVPFI